MRQVQATVSEAKLGAGKLEQYTVVKIVWLAGSSSWHTPTISLHRTPFGSVYPSEGLFLR